MCGIFAVANHLPHYGGYRGRGLAVCGVLASFGVVVKGSATSLANGKVSAGHVLDLSHRMGLAGIFAGICVGRQAKTRGPFLSHIAGCVCLHVSCRPRSLNIESLKFVPHFLVSNEA